MHLYCTLSMYTTAVTRSSGSESLALECTIASLRRWGARGRAKSKPGSGGWDWCSSRAVAGGERASKECRLRACAHLRRWFSFDSGTISTRSNSERQPSASSTRWPTSGVGDLHERVRSTWAPYNLRLVCMHIWCALRSRLTLCQSSTST